MELKLENMLREMMDMREELRKSETLSHRVHELEKENARLRRCAAVTPPAPRVPYEQPRQAQDESPPASAQRAPRPRSRSACATPEVPYEQSEFAQECARMFSVWLPDGVHSDTSQTPTSPSSCSFGPELHGGSDASPGGAPSASRSPAPPAHVLRSRSMSSFLHSEERAREHPVRVLTRGPSRSVLSSPLDAPGSMHRAQSVELPERAVSARNLRVRCPETDRPSTRALRAPQPVPSPAQPPPPSTPFMSPRSTARLPQTVPTGYPRAVPVGRTAYAGMQRPVIVPRVTCGPLGVALRLR